MRQTILQYLTGPKLTKTMKKSIHIFTFALVLLTSSSVSAQGIIMKAMEDEMERSMSELKYKEYDSPFYIRYQIDDTKQYQVSASLGALVSTYYYPARSKFIRVMAGNYEFNDESLDSNINQTPTGFNSWTVPLGDDYFGLRRSLWISSDQVYKSAARIYASHLNYLETKGKTIEETPHRRFAKVPVEVYTSTEKPIDISLEFIENKAKEVSSAFQAYPELHNSAVNAFHFTTDSYFLNSEGTKIQTIKNITMMQLSAAQLSESGELAFKQKYYLAEQPEKLPTNETIKNDITALVDEMKTQLEAEEFDGSYDGPVLFMDDAIPFLINNVVGNFSASDIETKNSGFGISYNTDPIDEKIGEKVASTTFSLSLIPHLREYKGQPLLGAYDFDGEGVRPADEIILVKNGLLENVMTSRTLAKDSHKPTGTNSGPGVVSVSVSESSTTDDLKAKLISRAKDQELEYAIVVRKFETGFGFGCNVYKVDLNDGSEQLMRSAQVSNFELKSLKKIKGGSADRKVYNLPNMGAGKAVSYIVPSALLIEDVEIEKNLQKIKIELPLVESP